MTSTHAKTAVIEVKSHQLGTLSTGVGLDCYALIVFVMHVVPLQKLGAGRFERLSVCLDASAGWKLSFEDTV